MHTPEKHVVGMAKSTQRINYTYAINVIASDHAVERIVAYPHFTKPFFFGAIYYRAIIYCLEHLCKNQKLHSAGKSENRYNWLVLLPILHFFRKDSLPYTKEVSDTDVNVTFDYHNPKWWGVENMGVDKITDIGEM